MENQLRLESYRQALEPQLLELFKKEFTLNQAIKHQEGQIKTLNLEYGMTFEETQQVLEEIWLMWISSSYYGLTYPKFETSDVY